MDYSKDVDSIFGIPSDGSNISPEDSDEHMYVDGIQNSDSSIPFEKKAKELKDKIGTDNSFEFLGSSDNSWNVNPLPQQQVKKTPEEAAQNIINAISKKEEVEVQPFETNDDIKENNKVVIEENSVSDEDDSDNKDDKQSSDSHKNSIYDSLEKYNFNWITGSSDPLFNDFYKVKNSTIKKIIGNNAIDFDKYEKELIDARVSFKETEIFDPKVLGSKIFEIQRWKDRVSQIEITINKQYFLVSRFREILHGVLAKTKTEKPIIKQEALVFEHLRDIEEYKCNLESLKKSTENVYKNLESAFDAISRNITVAMPSKEINMKK